MRNSRKKLNPRNIMLLSMMLLVCIFLVPDPARAYQELGIQKGKFALGVGYAIARFDTNFKFKDKQSDILVFIDGEGTLGLPESKIFPVLYGAYQFSEKSMLGFSYFRVRRESTLLDFDDTVDDINIAGRVTLTDDTKFYNLFYGHTFYVDERSRVQGLIGINGLDLKYIFRANGAITLPDDSITATYEEDAGVFAPLPLFGLQFWYAFTPQWGIETNVKFVAGQYQETKAWVLNSTINARYQFNKNVGGVLGVTYFDADVTIEDSEALTDVNYGYDGLFLGLHAIF